MILLEKSHINDIGKKDLNVIRDIDKKELSENFKIYNDCGKNIYIDIRTTTDKNHKEIKIISKIYYLPITSNYWDAFVNEDGLQSLFSISNYGLGLNKFGRFNKNKLDYIDYNGQDNLYHKFVFKDHWDIIAYTQKKQKDLRTELKCYFTVDGISVQQDWRLVLNLGETTAYNNGFLLHTIYGIPYLSDTAIKGMVRTYVIENYFDFKEDIALKNEVFIDLFGTANKQDSDVGEQENDKVQQGLIKFAQAFPMNTINDPYTIEADIINNHNEDYYADDNTVNYPSDSTAPIPIKYITLKKAIFEPYFYIAKQHETKKIVNSEDEFSKALEGKTLLEAMHQLMLGAFKVKGIGAKTNIGYGRLLNSETPKTTKSTDLLKPADLLQALPAIKFDNIKEKKTTTKVYIKDQNLKTATIKLDGELNDIQLIIDKGIDKTSLKSGQLIDVVIHQISEMKHKIVAVKLIET